MSLTLNPNARVATLVGALVLTGLAAIVFFVGRSVVGGEATADSSATLVITKPRATSTPKPAATSPRTTERVPSGFPTSVDNALRHSSVVVVSVSMPGAAVDRVVRTEARTAAKVTHAGFVPVSAVNELAVSGLVAKAGMLPSPAVVIVKRPGVVVTTFSVTDAGTIAQAVAQARR
jgi:hypothetical protein